MTDDLKNCHDCAVPPGQPHADGCDTARCLHTGLQRLACSGWHVTQDLSAHGVPLGVQERHDCGRDIWTGEWPGEAECIEFGWYCYENPGGNPWWVPCGPDHPGARPDLNRLHMDAEWDAAAGRWRKAAWADGRT